MSLNTIEMLVFSNNSSSRVEFVALLLQKPIQSSSLFLLSWWQCVLTKSCRMPAVLLLDFFSSFFIFAEYFAENIPKQNINGFYYLHHRLLVARLSSRAKP
ncbi:MAG: hypothetical protein ACEY3J_02180 [Arsenophonus sp.]